MPSVRAWASWRARRFGAISWRKSITTPVRNAAHTIADGASVARSCSIPLTSTHDRQRCPASPAAATPTSWHRLRTAASHYIAPGGARGCRRSGTERCCRPHPGNRGRRMPVVPALASQPQFTPPSETQEHARVPQGVGLHPIQIEELRDPVIVRPQQLCVHLRRNRRSADFSESVA